MRSIVGILRRRGVDALTLLLVGLAAYLATRPGSVVRGTAASYKRDFDTNRAVKRNWADLAQQSSHLYEAGGPPTVIEVSDYECPFCRQNSPGVDSAVAAGARVAYLHLPLPSHPQAAGAAKAALCAEQAGRFREMHGRLMGTSQWRTDSNFTREAQLAGVSDLPGFERCMRSGEVQQRLDRHRALADSLRVNVTPTFVWRGGTHRGLVSGNDLLRVGAND